MFNGTFGPGKKWYHNRVNLVIGIIHFLVVTVIMSIHLSHPFMSDIKLIGLVVLMTICVAILMVLIDPPKRAQIKDADDKLIDRRN